MGKATITAGGADGLYTVSRDYGSSYIDARVAELQEEVDAAQEAIDALTPKLLTASNAERDARYAVDNAIAVYRASGAQPGSEEWNAMVQAVENVAPAAAELAALNRDLATEKVVKSGAEAEIARLKAELLSETREAWCCTFTEDGEGEVATIEVNGELPACIIAPECRTPTAADGDYRDRLAMSASATYLNAALLPGWQRHKPTFRVGVISNIDTGGNTCTVTLDDVTSSAQDLPINPDDRVLTDVPIVYLDCNAQAFESGDRVVVQFVAQDWEQPKVIGFESNPRPCTQFVWVSANRRDYTGASFTDNRVTVKIDPADLSIVDTFYFAVLGLPNDTARQGGTAYTLLNGAVLDLQDGSAEISLPTDESALAISAEHVYTITNDFSSLQSHSWPEGTLDASLALPQNTVSGSPVTLVVDKGIAANNAAVALTGYMQSEIGTSADIRLHVYEPGLTALRWSQSEETNAGLETYGVAVSNDYAAVLYSLDDVGFTNRIRVRDISDGSLVRTIDITGIGVNDPRPRDITIRGDDLLLLLEHPIGAAQPYRRDLRRFDLLTGVPASPDAEATDIHGAYRESDDERFGDFGSMD